MHSSHPTRGPSTMEGCGARCHPSDLSGTGNVETSESKPLTCWVESEYASSAKTRGFHTQLDEGPETP